MKRKLQAINLEDELVQLIVRELVEAGLDSPLRETIIEAVEGEVDRPSELIGDRHKDSDQESDKTIEEPTAEPEHSHLTKLVQGGTVFVIMFVILYFIFRQLTRDNNSE